MKLHLEIPEGTAHTPRIRYAWKVFAAVRGHVPVEPPYEADVSLRYGREIAAHYHANTNVDAPRATFRWRDVDIPLFLSTPGEGIDALGELFLWLSGAIERATTRRDPVGRIPFEAGPHGRFGLDPSVPYAAVLADFLDATVTGVAPRRHAESHWVWCTHDVDFYFVDRPSAAVRLAKNALIAALVYRRFDYFCQSIGRLLALAFGARPGEFANELARKTQAHGVRSTALLIPRGSHRRDGNYRLSDVKKQFSALEAAGIDLGVHGSYCSIVEENDLRADARAFEAVFEKRPRANRQHWLRFHDYDILFEAVRTAGFRLDSSVGYTDRPGFRHGACFPYPPYDFRREAPYPFLEVPLVLMDVTLTRLDAARAGEEARKVLAASRRWGSGGIAILWHDPVEPLAVPSAINDLYWTLADERTKHGDEWVNGVDLWNVMASRYRGAGLLSDARETVATPGARTGVETSESRIP